MTLKSELCFVQGLLFVRVNSVSVGSAAKNPFADLSSIFAVVVVAQLMLIQYRHHFHRQAIPKLYAPTRRIGNFLVDATGKYPITLLSNPGVGMVWDF